MKTYIKDSLFNKAKPKFKQGDRVKVYNFNENPIGTIVCPQYKNNTIYYYVDLYGGEYRAAFKEDDLELQKEIAASMGKRRFTKYPSNYVNASSDMSGRWQVYYYEPIFVDRYNPDDNWSDYSRTPEGSGRYAVYDGKKVVVGTFDTEEEAERKCHWGMQDSYPDGTPFTVDFNYEQI